MELPIRDHRPEDNGIKDSIVDIYDQEIQDGLEATWEILTAQY